MKNNPPLGTVIVWAVITALAILVIFLPAILGIKGFDGGFAISTLGFFLAICGIIVMIVYGLRVRKLARILRGEGVLAHWTYSSEEWQKYTEKEYKTEKGEKKALFIVISVIALVVGVVFFLIDHKGGAWVLLGMVGLIAILAFTAWFTTWYNHRQNVKNQGEAYIADKAVYLNRQLHTWYGPGDQIESVDISKKGNPSILAIKYSVITRTGRTPATVRIPIPAGKEPEAEEILGKLKAAIA